MRSLLFYLFRLTGLVHLLQRLNRNSVAIFMLHGVMDEMAPSSWVPLRPQLSRKQLRLTLKTLSSYYHLVGMEDAVQMLSGQAPFQPNCMVLTFDDGYRNQLKHAWPILQEFGAPATIFLATGHIESRKPFWFDRLDYAIQQARLSGRRFTAGNEVVVFPSEDRNDLRVAFKRLRDSAKIAPRPDRLMVLEMESMAKSLEEECGCRLEDIFEEDDWTGLLTWQEIRAAASQEGLTFGSHTVDHTRLGGVNEKEIRKQLLLSKQSIERHTGKECRYFCFPSGSFSSLSVRLLKECGYEAAVTTQEGINRPGQDLFRLYRISPPSNGDKVDLLWRTFQLSRPKAAFGLGPTPVTECLTGD
jgi:peptidoglycan/xylan/chitin deacetylase (PgdA/CDA1 family)